MEAPTAVAWAEGDDGSDGVRRAGRGGHQRHIDLDGLHPNLVLATNSALVLATKRRNWYEPGVVGSVNRSAAA